MFNLYWELSWAHKSSSYYFFSKFFVRNIFELAVMWQEANYCGRFPGYCNVSL